MTMTRLFTLFLFLISASFSSYAQTAAKTDLPPALGYVSDYENIFTGQEETRLDSLIRAIEKRTTVEIAVVTIDSTMTSPSAFHEYTLQLARAWGVGKKDKDNGILIGISQSLRMVRIENGFGVEKKISDAQTLSIIEKKMLPHFRNGDVFQGTFECILALIKKLE